MVDAPLEVGRGGFFHPEEPGESGVGHALDPVDYEDAVAREFARIFEYVDGVVDPSDSLRERDFAGVTRPEQGHRALVQRALRRFQIAAKFVQHGFVERDALCGPVCGKILAHQQENDPRVRGGAMFIYDLEILEFGVECRGRARVVASASDEDAGK